MDLHILSIPHRAQRYDTCGDYWPAFGGRWEFRISEMDDADHMFLVAMHELTEWWWAQKNQVPNAVIDEFDMAFELARRRGERTKEQEPGDDPACPVYEGHQFGCAVERLLAAALGIKWQQYDDAFDKLPVWRSPEARERVKRARQKVLKRGGG